MTARTGLVTAACIAMGVVFVGIVAREARGQSTVRATVDGVTVWVPAEKFQGDMGLLQKNRWEDVAAEALPRTVAGEPVIAAGGVLAAFDSAGGRVAIYTRDRDRLHERAVASLPAAARPTQYKLVRDAARSRLGVEIYSGDARQFTVWLSGDGIFEFAPGAAGKLALRHARTSYGIVPSLIGTDLVYDPRRWPDKDSVYVPSMSLYVGLMAGGDCMMVAAWPPGRQVVKLDLAGAGADRVIDGLSVDMAGEGFHLALLAAPQIWHVEALRPEYLERDTEIAWKRPLEARWIGRFYVESEGIHFPFFFHREKLRMWGRCIRGWFYYPVWFDGPRSLIHFEKRFPPEGEMLIYFLEKHPGTLSGLSPVAVMQQALGTETAAKLLDFDGIRQRPLLAHGNAVCAMTNGLQKVFDAGQQAKQQALVAVTADDVAEFIRLIRERVFEYAEFAGQMREFLRGQAQADAQLAAALEPLHETLDEMDEVRQSGMPRVSLEEVRAWTAQMKDLARQVDPDDATQHKQLGQKCRNVAGAQDDVARDLSIRTIRLIEQAGQLAVDSPERAELARQIIANSRAVLRHPTWWEPRRNDMPKSDPGIP